jgi:hypothetical protein
MGLDLLINNVRVHLLNSPQVMAEVNSERNDIKSSGGCKASIPDDPDSFRQFQVAHDVPGGM